MDAIFGQSGVLARTLPRYEARSGQAAMAKAVALALEQGAPGPDHPANLLAVEAGTGTGKTLAYLIPAVLSGRKVVVSTNTINLQEQILAKEIPFLVSHIAPDLSALCVKGRQNYLCLYRWRQVLAAPPGKVFQAGNVFENIQAWLEETETGDRSELPWLADDAALWSSISSTTGQCLGTHCPEGATCFLNRLRKKAARAQLLIVNHHLFFSDLALRRLGHAEVLPRYESVIFDEAHHLENIATRSFGLSVSQHQILDLVRDVERLGQTELTGRDRKRTIQTARTLASQADLFFSLFPREKGRFPLLRLLETLPRWEAEKQALADRFVSLEAELEELMPAGEAWHAMARRCGELLFSFKDLTEGFTSSHVYWYEKREKTVLLSASPIEVAGELQESLYSVLGSAVFTSATLTTGGTFQYFRDRLGLPRETETLLLDTPFDYAGRTLLYVPEDGFPEPARPDFPDRFHKTLAEIIGHSSGRALVLFTSIRAMKNAHAVLADRLPYPVFIQGEAPKPVLLEKFHRNTHSVLLAVASFWEGVDVPGESLSCVIIDKLPFEVPSDPVIMARIDKIKQDGGNPFLDFQIPRAILMLRQGVGRLMRSSTDRGLLAIMDVRLFSKRYGSLFLKSLPASPVTRALADVKCFFAEN